MQGNEKKGGEYVHFGAEFWTHHGTEPETHERELVKNLLTTFTDSVIREQDKEPT